jgi:hypothetical protein
MSRMTEGIRFTRSPAEHGDEKRRTIRLIILTPLTLVLAGCSSDPNSERKPLASRVSGFVWKTVEYNISGDAYRDTHPIEIEQMNQYMKDLTDNTQNEARDGYQQPTWPVPLSGQSNRK